MITQALHRVYRSMQRRLPATLWYGDPLRREIALTFDDGPHLRDTPGVLDVLAKHDVRATFFLIGQEVEKYPDLVRTIHNTGHQIGIHCHRHRAFPLEDARALRRQLEETTRLISETCGVLPQQIRDVRPPYGLFNKETMQVLHLLNFRIVMWNCIPPHFMQPLRWSVKQILEAALPGSIFVLHDGHGHGRLAVQILEAIIPALKAQGYEFITIEQMQDRKLS